MTRTRVRESRVWRVIIEQRRARHIDFMSCAVFMSSSLRIHSAFTTLPPSLWRQCPQVRANPMGYAHLGSDPRLVANVVAIISHRAGADRDSKPGTLNPVESQLLSTEPQQLARDI